MIVYSIRHSFGIILSGIMLLIAAPSIHAAGDDWRLGTEKNGIKVYTRKSDQGKMRTSRAEMTLPISVEQVIALLNDFNSYGSWFPSCRSAKILKRISDDEFLAILTYKTPWPLPDLDCAERMTIVRRRDTSYINVNCEPDAAPLTSATRIRQMHAYWKLIPVKDGTYVINEYYTDMGGIIPAWLANTQAVEIPFNIFSGVRQHVREIYGR
ncbi:MAG: hypothetical protein JSS76_11660 [Bacteroidetes bacterium]|nr:hypothetical protein [Bacteroidota bacterium]